MNGQKVYSKWETKAFPNLDDLKDSVQKFVS